MNAEDQKLRDALKAVQVPPASETMRAEAWDLARVAWRQSRTATSAAANATPQTNTHWLWGVSMAGVAFAVVLMVALLVNQPPRPAAPEAPGHLLAEMEKLFPGQVLAVVRQGSNVDLQLDDSPAPTPTDQALRINLVRGTQHLEVLTYSGRTVSAKFDGQATRFTPMLTSAGKLIFVTDDEVLAVGGKLAGFAISGERLAGHQS